MDVWISGKIKVESKTIFMKGMKMTDLRGKVTGMRSQMKRLIIGHDDAVDGTLMGLLTGCHVMLIGPPGVAKSLICDGWLDRIDVPGFRIAGDEFKIVDELLGPVTFSNLKNDNYKRESHIYDESGNEIGVFMPAAKLSFTDELSRFIGPCASTMLSILNEGHYYDGQQRVDSNLWCNLAAMNFLPDEEEAWGAIMDRFILRYYIPRIAATDTATRHMIFTRPSLHEPSEMLTADEFQQVCDEVSKVEVGEDVLDLFLCQDLIPGLHKLSESIFDACSDRRIHKAVKVMQARAWLEGRERVLKNDGLIYKHVLWNELHEIEEVAKMVHEYAGIVDVTFDGNTLPEELQSVVELHRQRSEQAMRDCDSSVIVESTNTANSAIDDIERDWTAKLKNQPDLELRLGNIQNARAAVAVVMEKALMAAVGA